MVTQFLDQLGIPHDAGHVATDTLLDASEYSICKNAEDLAAQYGQRAVAIMLVVYRVQGVPLGEKARKWLKGGWDGPPPRATEEDAGDGDAAAARTTSRALKVREPAAAPMPMPVEPPVAGHDPAPESAALPSVSTDPDADVDQTEDADKDDPSSRRR